VCLFTFAGNYQILNELTHNLKTNAPQVKIKDLKKNKFTSMKEIDNSNLSIQSSVLTTDVSETQFDSSACITSSIDVSVASESKCIIKILNYLK